MIIFTYLISIIPDLLTVPKTFAITDVALFHVEVDFNIVDDLTCT